MKNENREALKLGLVGLSLGVFKEVVQPELTAKRAWAAIAIGVTAYELACKDGELLSEGVDRAIDKHPVVVPLAIGYVAAHLANRLPGSVDIFHQITKLKSS